MKKTYVYDQELGKMVEATRTAVAERSFARVWENPEDAAYDIL